MGEDGGGRGGPLVTGYGGNKQVPRSLPELKHMCSYLTHSSRFQKVKNTKYILKITTHLILKVSVKKCRCDRDMRHIFELVSVGRHATCRPKR